MSKQNTFDNIMNYFNSEDEEEDEVSSEEENAKTSHKLSSSLTPNTNNNILNSYEPKKNAKDQKIKRDMFGYIISNDYDEENSESENENENHSFKENCNQESEQTKKDENKENYDADDKEEHNNNQNNQSDFYSDKESMEIEENDSNTNNFNFQLLNSFRPNAPRISPRFIQNNSITSDEKKNIQNNNNENNNNENKNNENKNKNNENNNVNNNNENISGFTETIDAKIEGGRISNNQNNYYVNDNNNKNIYSHNGIVSLGKMPNVDNCKNINGQGDLRMQTFHTNENIPDNKNENESNDLNVNDNQKYLMEQEAKKQKIKNYQKNLNAFINKNNNRIKDLNENNNNNNNDDNKIIHLGKRTELYSSQKNNNKVQDNKLYKNNTSSVIKTTKYTNKFSNNKNSKKSKNNLKKIQIPISNVTNSYANQSKYKNNKIINTSLDNNQNNLSKNLISSRSVRDINNKINTTSKKNNNNNNIYNKSKNIKKQLFNKNNHNRPPLPNTKSVKNVRNEAVASSPNKINNNNSKIKIKKNGIPFEIRLYEDANDKKEKFDRICITEMDNIKSNSNIKKINNKSYNLAAERVYKKINSIVNKYSIMNKGKLTIVNLAQCLSELQLLNELTKNKNLNQINNYNFIENLNLDDLKNIIKKISEKDVIKLEELEFLEQFWFIINPNLNEFVHKETVLHIFKMLFSNNKNISIKDIISDIENYLNNLNKNSNNYLSNKNNNSNINYYISPLRNNKKYLKDNIWSINKFVHIFMNMKENIKAYKNINSQLIDMQNNILKEREKELTFQPDICQTSNYFYKNVNSRNANISNLNSEYSNSKNKKNTFDKFYDRVMNEKNLREKALDKMRELQLEKELKMCTNKPKINSYYKPKYPKKESKDDIYSSANECYHSEYNNDNYKNYNNKSIYDKLYSMNSYSSRANTEENLDIRKYPFKPTMISDDNEMTKSFINYQNRKPKGFIEYVRRNRSLIAQKENDKKLEQEQKYGKNYEKILKMKIRPPNITDFTHSKSKSRKKSRNASNNTKNYTHRSSNLSKKNECIKNIFNIDNYNNNMSVIDDVFITIQVKIPNGELKPLKIRNSENVIDTVNDFCSMYNINEESKKQILYKVLSFKNSFLKLNMNNYDNKYNDEFFMLNEDLETVTNSNSNSNRKLTSNRSYDNINIGSSKRNNYKSKNSNNSNMANNPKSINNLNEERGEAGSIGTYSSIYKKPICIKNKLFSCNPTKSSD